MTYGDKLNAWRSEWEANEDLRFQFPRWNDYAYRRLREAWEASRELRLLYGDDYRAFMTATKKEAGNLVLAACNASAREAEKHRSEEAIQKRGSPLRQFVDRLLRKQERANRNPN
ncbi:hypothetical protein GFB56_09915 [Ensifer sp. T173]|uniref:Uncharacterized protein n=1 Tax=Ensifer canadensis TaxID=555315 RepID=A0AAW4FKJ2_9HYPH|nr:hypothetical protein [Ensifer canadensis]MBM3091132.1 hypothetical protein [Ensifer canadensis]UBI75814.1 hypothetical protein J3R84_01240 [Ensifer canadensis]